VITTPNGLVRLQGESGVAARLVPVTVGCLILAAPEADPISWPLRELVVGELDDQRDDDAQQDDPDEGDRRYPHPGNRITKVSQRAISRPDRATRPPHE
jgi:hypothetical protein